MLLINAETLQVEEFLDNAAPKYAILSHTWGDEEVSLQQFLHSETATKAKAGYSKIKHACDQALKRGLRYTWVDTCCIDKTSSAELSEAINSMSRWYEEAEVYFAYLVDVPPAKDKSDTLFGVSRWFARGWTLQELLAPPSLEFFSLDWTFIANRKDLASHISNITGIHEMYLADFNLGSRHDLLAKASIAERMSWASERITTRKEDAAYCLLGIFGVNMPLIYGEGTTAFLRLQEEILRSYFDPTILAWNADHNGQPLLIEGPKPYSSWRLALKMLAGMEHPWCESSQPSTDGPLRGILAPDPECFLYCKDIVPCDVALDWSITSDGLKTVLPVSQNKEPYVIIPCRLRHDPWNLLALPLKSHAKNIYSRSGVSAKFVNHYAWHQWPQKDLLLRTKIQSDLSTIDKFRCGLWIRSLPQTMRLLHVYSTDGWTSGGRLIQIRSTSKNHPLSDHGLAAMLIETEDTNETFGIIINVSESLRSPFSTFWLWGSVIGRLQSKKLECRFIMPASRDSILSLLSKPSQLGSMPKQLDFQGSIAYTTVTQKYLLDLLIFEIDIKKSSGRLDSLIRRFAYNFNLEIIKQITNALKRAEPLLKNSRRDFTNR